MRKSLVCMMLLMSTMGVYASTHYSISVNNKTKFALVITDQKTIKGLDYEMTNVNNYAPGQETKKSEITSDGVKIEIVAMRNIHNDCVTENFSLPIEVDTVPDSQEPKILRFVVEALKNKKNVCLVKLVS
jgi:hypothetical protein